ncbi:MAG: lactonase family protein [Planctomycetaceae bacterium]
MVSLLLACLWADPAPRPIPPAVSSPAATVFVSFAGETRLARFRQDPQTGELLALPSIPLPGHAGAMLVNRRATVLVVALREEGRLCTLSLTAPVPELLSDLPAGEDPAYIAFDREERFLFTAYYVSNKVTVHRFDATGHLSAEPVQSLATDRCAHAVQPDRSNRFVFVPHTAANAIYQFRFDAQRGRLVPNDPPVLKRPERTGPRHLVFHPRLPVVYVNNEQENSVSWYAWEDGVGTLRWRGTQPSLPAGVEVENATADLELHPSGETLYCANRGHNSLALFAVDRGTGAIHPQGHEPTEAIPREFHLTPDGRYAYVAGEGSGRLAAYRIMDRGRLQRFATYEAGRQPFWVLVVPDPVPER